MEENALMRADFEIRFAVRISTLHFFTGSWKVFEPNRRRGLVMAKGPLW
jgi:hypothetical protein